MTSSCRDASHTASSLDDTDTPHPLVFLERTKVCRSAMHAPTSLGGKCTVSLQNTLYILYILVKRSFYMTKKLNKNVAKYKISLGEDEQPVTCEAGIFKIKP